MPPIVRGLTLPQGIATTDLPQFAGVRLTDAGTLFYLQLVSDSTAPFTANRILTLDIGDAARTLTLSGNPTLADWFDQAVKAASSPTFAGLTLTAFSGFVKATAGVLSAAALVDGDIPNTITLDNITQITARSHTNLGDIGSLSHATLDSYLDQSVKIAASPVFAGLTLTAFSGFVKATAGVLSAAALVDGDIPDTITLTNITQITNRSHTSLSDIGSLTHATLDSYLDQAVKQASTPIFAGLTLTAFSGFVKATTGVLSAAAIADGDLPSALTGKTYNALTPIAQAIGFTIAGGTTSKTLTVDETVSMSAKAPKASPVFTGDVTLAGKVTNSTLPAFLVATDETQLNIALDTYVQIIWQTEIKDQGDNFAANIFTAPITGMYQLSLILGFGTYDASQVYYFRLLTSNRNYLVAIPADFLPADGAFTFTTSILADMDAADTAQVHAYQVGGIQQTDINVSFFSGFLVC